VLGLGKFTVTSRLIFLVTIIGSTGFLDDFAGSKDHQGFNGHFTQLLSGTLTTGAFKAIISLVTVLLVVTWGKSLFVLIINISLILLMTNFLNLLDVKPGRTLKFFFFLSFILILMMPTYRIYFLPIYILLIIYTPFELNEKIMLGDSGANILGVIVGYFLSQWGFTAGKTFILLLLLTLTFISEKYSFSQFIAKSRTLNWIDCLGRKD
jgi:hypothetical protein